MAIKLMAVSGPTRGATYFLQDGETVIGRAPEATIVAASSQVSKRHCAIICTATKAEIKDLGSSNGTFVNGVLIKRKLLKDHDRVMVGAFVYEILIPQPVAVSLGSSNTGVDGQEGDLSNLNLDPGQMKLDEEPKGLIPKYVKKFDDLFLPVLYDRYENMDYQTLFVLMFVIYVFMNLGFTVYPTLLRSREEILQQAEHQAKYISGQIAELNKQYLSEKKESNLFTDFAQSESNVIDALIVNMEGRILAPGNRLNEFYNDPYFLKYRDLMKKSQKLWGKPILKRFREEERISAFTPIMVMSQTKGYHIPAAISVVSYATAETALDSGTIGTVYFEALSWSCLLGAVFLYLLYKVTHRPIVQLTDDLDKALRGNADAIEKKYQNDYISKLIDGINSALSRIPKSADTGAQTNVSAGETEQVIIDNLMRGIEMIMSKGARPFVFFDLDMRIKMINTPFEELTGIRDAIGELIDTVSRDESFPALLKEMAGKANDAGNEGISEDYDFNSGLHKVFAIALSGMPGKIESYLFIFIKAED